MSETSKKEARPQVKVSLLTGMLVILAAIAFLYVLFGVILPPDVVPLARRVKCQANLKLLGMMLTVYADENHGTYPSDREWCDVLVAEHGDEQDMSDVLLCREDETGPCSYAMNTHADPNSAGDMVLLFESKPGWNQSGGRELFATKNHADKGASVLFVDGTVMFVKAADVSGLKWEDEGALLPPLPIEQQGADDEE